MRRTISRRTFLDTTVKAAARALRSNETKPAASTAGSRIVDIHTHFEPGNSGYIDEFLRVSDQLNLTGSMLTPFENRKVVAEAAKQHPTQNKAVRPLESFGMHSHPV